MAVSLETLHRKARSPLEAALNPGEQVLAWIHGISHQAMALTSERVIVVKPGFMAGNAFGANVSSYPLRQITSVELVRKIGTSWLVVRAAGVSDAMPTLQSNRSDGYKLPNVIPLGNVDVAQRFAQSVTASLNSIHTPPAPAQPREDMPLASVADELSKLAALRDQGVLTAEEFAAQKAKLLGA